MRAKTIRKLPPLTREFARLSNEMDSLARRFKNRLAKIEALEVEIALLQAEKEHCR